MRDVLAPEWRSVGDPPADELLTNLASADEAWAATTLLRTVRHNGDALPDALPTEVRSFVDRAAEMPCWADAERLRRAARWADGHLPFLSVSLLAASMPLLFAGQRGAGVLRATGRLETDVDRRVNETGRFVLDTVCPGGFAPNGSAIIGSVKVRLLHAAVRRSLRDRLGVSTGVPINQQQMVATLLGFSVVALRSVERLGAKVRARDAEDYYHLWRVVGHLQGIEPGLVPESVHEARALLTKMHDAIDAPTEDGKVLTAVLVDGMERHMPPLPGMAIMPRRLVRYLLGDRIADLLDVPRAPEPSPAFLHATGWLTRRAPGVVTTLAPRAARLLHAAIVRHKLGGAKAVYEANAVSAR